MVPYRTFSKSVKDTILAVIQARNQIFSLFILPHLVQANTNLTLNVSQILSSNPTVITKIQLIITMMMDNNMDEV